MDIGNLIEIVNKSAPLLGSALGGPLGGVIGEIVAHVFGGNTQDSAALTQIIQQDPDHDIKLKKIENDHIEALQGLNNQLIGLEVSDRESARNLASMDHGNDSIMHFIAILYIVGYFVYICLFSTGVIQKDSQVLQYLNSGTGFIIAFYFGASYTQHRLNNKS